VFVATAGKAKAKGFLQAYKLVDGTPVWKQELDDAAISYPVASGDWVAIATADDKIAVFRASDGKPREPIIVGGKPVAPAISNDVLIVAGHERIAAYDLAASDWLWNYKDQDNIGDVIGQPVICNETIWVGTTKRGLVSIGVPKK
jgi:outer membrane protein assembly factor BamB